MITNYKKTGKAERYQNAFFSVFLIILFLAIAVFLVYSNFNIGRKRVEMAAKIDLLQAQIKAIEEEKANLETKIQAAQGDVYWEAKMREQGFQKPGEQTVVVLPQEEQASSTSQKNFFQKILEKIGL